MSTIGRIYDVEGETLWRWFKNNSDLAAQQGYGWLVVQQQWFKVFSFLNDINIFLYLFFFHGRLNLFSHCTEAKKKSNTSLTGRFALKQGWQKCQNLEKRQKRRLLKKTNFFSCLFQIRHFLKNYQMMRFRKNYLMEKNELRILRYRDN